jgi:hypothetical protein
VTSWMVVDMDWEYVIWVIDKVGNFAIGVIALFITIIAVYYSIKRAKIDAPNIKEPLKDLSAAKSVQQIAASQLDILSEYYNNVLRQSQRSFYFALISAGIGLMFIIAAAGFLLLNQLQEISIITLLGGALSGFVSGVNFYLYNKSSFQMAEFHSRLETTQRFLLADGLINTIINSDMKDETRRSLIDTIAGINAKQEAKDGSDAPNAASSKSQ